MSRRRMIDPTLWEDEHFGQLSDKAKILFISCISNADDDGRLSGNPSNLRALAFRFEDLSIKRIEDLTLELQEKMKNLSAYTVNGCQYIQLHKWEDYQTQREDRRRPSRLPDVSQMSDTCQTDVCVSKVKLSKDKISKVKLSVIANSFESVWCRYPNRVGKKAAERQYRLTVKTQADLDRINKAIDNYVQSERVRKGYVQNGSTWFNDWETWVTYTPPEKEQVDREEAIMRKAGVA